MSLFGVQAATSHRSVNSLSSTQEQGESTEHEKEYRNLYIAVRKAARTEKGRLATRTMPKN